LSDSAEFLAIEIGCIVKKPSDKKQEEETEPRKFEDDKISYCLIDHKEDSRMKSLVILAENEDHQQEFYDFEYLLVGEYIVFKSDDETEIRFFKVLNSDGSLIEAVDG